MIFISLLVLIIQFPLLIGLPRESDSESDVEPSNRGQVSLLICDDFLTG